MLTATCTLTCCATVPARVSLGGFLYMEDEPDWLMSWEHRVRDSIPPDDFHSCAGQPLRTEAWGGPMATLGLACGSLTPEAVPTLASPGRGSAPTPFSTGQSEAAQGPRGSVGLGEPERVPAEVAAGSEARPCLLLTQPCRDQQEKGRFLEPSLAASEQEGIGVCRNRQGLVGSLLCASTADFNQTSESPWALGGRSHILSGQEPGR